MTYEERLNERIQKTGSRLCVGLDPRPDLIRGDVAEFLRRAVAETTDYAAAFKPNIAYFEAMGPRGYQMLEDIIRSIPPDVPVILDAKRADIPETQKYYAQAYFEKWNVAAVTVNPYLGFDSCLPFLSYPGKGVYLLGLTSNGGSNDIQRKPSENGEVCDHVFGMAAQARSCPATPGLVVGLTSVTNEMLARIPDVPLLIPGLGAQGGDLKILSKIRRASPILVNVSRSLLYGSEDEKIRQRARTYVEVINHALQN